MSTTTVINASVKVMRSYDYCHFEIVLGASVYCPPDSPEWFQQIDRLRKNAARLADKAVEQYKIAKEAFESEHNRIDSLTYAAEQAEAKPESERTVGDKAAIKALADARFQHRHYNYEDEWNDDNNE